MTRQVGEGVVVTGGVYPLKSPVTLTDLRPETYGAFIAQYLAKTVKGNPRVVNEVLMIVNPSDYLRRIMSVTLGEGSAFYNGYRYENTEPLSLAIPTANASLNRIDAIMQYGRFIKRKAKRVEL